ncbi:MAG: hypothetical protein N2Z79_04815, partial [Candidatus Omnitrophica bacterium]|nr:hypothetical protein [Candidatus Omnitrophota bacterium]
MRNFAFISSDAIEKKVFFLKFLSDLRNRNYKTIPLKPLKAYLVSFPCLPENNSALDRILYLKEFIKENEIELLGWSGFRYFDSKTIGYLNRSLEVSVTSGISLVGWSIFECVYRFLRARKLSSK